MSGMLDPFHLSGEQIVRLAEALPPLCTAGAALSAAMTSLLVALHARRAANHAQQTADDATSQAILASREQIKFQLEEFVRQNDSLSAAVARNALPPIADDSPVLPLREGGVR